MYVVTNAGRIDLSMTGQKDPDTGQYLAAWNLDADHPFDAATWVSDPAKAHRFATMIEAMETWKSVSTAHPIRRDGQPNRPLTLWSVSFEEASN